ncbi:MAG: ABC transporter ATP-binding protein [Anaerolineales bacterium]|nr:ABC transporter ATP-binding protein [Anaerolineales bacterium]
MIQVRAVSKQMGGVRAVCEVSLEIPDQGALVILGPSGSGKTTLLRLMAGLELPDAGEIAIDGKLASKPGWGIAPHERGIGFVFQSPTLWPHLTVAQNVGFGLTDRPRAEADKQLQKLLEQSGLAALARRFPHQLSGGEARRVALARALAPKPRHLLLDEPLINLDPEAREGLLQFTLACAQESKASVVWVTHDVQEAEQISGQQVILQKGRLQAPG